MDESAIDKFTLTVTETPVSIVINNCWYSKFIWPLYDFVHSEFGVGFPFQESNIALWFSKCYKSPWFLSFRFDAMSNVHGLEYCYDLYIIRNGNQLAFAVPINRLLSFLASVPFYDRHTVCCIPRDFNVALYSWCFAYLLTLNSYKR